MRTSAYSSLVLGLFAVLCLACGDDVKTVPPTQITARVYVARDLALATLHVQSASQVGSSWQTISTQSYAAASIRDLQPVDIHFVPKAGTRDDKQIEIVIEARNAAGTPLAQERALVKFVPQKQRGLELWLDACGGGTPVCESSATCHGTSCGACVSGTCGATRTYPADALLPLDPEVRPDPDKDPPSGPPVTAVTCATGAIACDDGNPCNGIETCDPGRSGAMANGCALIQEAKECGAGTTCLQRTGDCASCAQESDGDGDRSASMACGGNDCDDNDAKRGPGLPELCDGKDNNCNGSVDEAPGADADCTSQAAADVTASCNMGRCEQTNQRVTVRFRAKVGDAPLTCGREYLNLGSGTDPATPQDFRFYVQELLLINAQGAAVPVTFDVRPPWQSASVALIDFTNGAGSCVGGETTNVEIRGTVPPGSYTGVEFVNGVPETLNRVEPVAPLTPDSFRGPVAGHRFVMAALATSARPAGMDDAGVRDAGATDGGVRPAPAPDAGGGSISTVYLGSSGCTAGGCTNANRSRVRLTGFDPATQVIVADLAKVFTEIDLAQSLTCDVDPPAACAPGYAALGVDGNGMQSVFSVERAD